MARSVIFKDVLDKLREEQSVDVTMPDGSVIRIEPYQLWSEAAWNASDPTDQARLILGDQYDAFVAAGGTSRLIASLIADATGESLPE